MKELKSAEKGQAVFHRWVLSPEDLDKYAKERDQGVLCMEWTVKML